MIRRYRLYGLLFAGLLGASGLGIAEWRWTTIPAESGAGFHAPAIGGPFVLTAADGSTVTEASYRGKILLVYFGYTTCPDACPTTLNAIAAALAELGPLADDVQPLFITIDPERDTRAVLANYVKAFDSRIVGLTGTPDQIAAAAKAYGVYYARYKSADAPDGYLMDHTSVVFVMNEQHRFVATFTQDTPAAQMSDRLRKLIAKTS
ncbi:MAG TPA: SCO family protein [Stellaceae bacterium]|nr:SCO family protein [Stellaceae bacterium]